MATTTVEDLAKELKRTPAALLEQLQAAGIKKESPGDKITEKDKTKLLEFLQAAHGSSESGSRKKITLTKRETSEIRQADSAGRTRTVQVEVRKKRVLVKRDEAPAEPVKEEVKAPAKPVVDEAELAKREAEAKKQAELLARQEAEMKAQLEKRAQEEAEAKKDQEKTESPAQEPAAVKEKAADEGDLEALRVRRAKAEAEALAIREMMSTPARVLKAPKSPEEEKKGTLHKPVKAEGEAKKADKPKPGAKTIKSSESSSTWQEDGKKRPGGLKTRGDTSGGVDGWRSGGKKRHQQAQAEVASNFVAPTEPVVRDVHVPETITVSDLAHKMSVKAAEVIKLLMGMGQMVTINQVLDQDTAMIIIEEMGHRAHAAKIDDPESELQTDAHDAEMLPRPPVVTVMGHVDHGKTSLLDKIRLSKVAAGEAGGITQHIGAYHVETPRGMITFLDTPGHEAFTAMRARGAKATDIVILVVAADDGVMPQTKEAIAHAKAANVPMIFAVNKIDKDGANAQKIYEQLSQMNILVEAWGGKFQNQELSAKQGLNVDALLEKVILESDLLELKANPNREASGSIIEASLDKGRGYVATILVQNGTLKQGDLILSGQFYGRVKAMFNERNQRIEVAPPSTPVVILGLNGAPQAGEKFKVFEDEAEAKEIATKRAQLLREQGLRTRKHITLDEIGRRLALGNFKELNIIIKGDVDGSVEALSDSLQKLSTEEIAIRVILKGVGQISESDVLLSAASDAIIIGFNVRPSMQANKLADTEGVQIKLYSIIYNAIDEIKSAMEGMLEPKIQEKIVANVEVREVYKFDKATVAGCFVLDGKISRNSKIRIIRDGIVEYPKGEGQSAELGSLKRFKDDVKDVVSNMECGLTIKNFADLKVGDIVEAFEEEEVKRTL